jgi:hypothetical protein
MASHRLGYRRRGARWRPRGRSEGFPLVVDASTGSSAVLSILCPSLMEFGASNEPPSQPVSRGAIARVVDTPPVNGLHNSSMAASGKAPLAFGSSDTSYSVADQQNACLPPDHQVLPDATGLMSTSADPTTRLHANSKGRHEPERPQAPPASGRPLKERPTGTSVTRQANTPNSKDYLNYRNSSEALSPGFPASLLVGRANPMPDATRREIGEYCSSGIDAADRPRPARHLL